MRVAFVGFVVAVLALVGTASYAGPFPDLPGMGAATRATEGKLASGGRSTNGPAATSSPAPQSGTSSGGTSSSASVKPPSAGTIIKLPGTGAVPAISDLASNRAKLPHTDSLLLFAAIGTATALGMLWAVRHRYES